MVTVDDSADGEVVEDLGAVLPGVGVAVLSVDLIVEADVMLTRFKENRGVPAPAKILAEKLRKNYADPKIVGELNLLLQRAD